MQPNAPALPPLSRSGQATTVSNHVQVCPPQYQQANRPLWQRLVAGLTALTPWAPREDQHLANVRAEFIEALADMPGQHVQALTLRLSRARSLRELWHLRTSIYNIVAVQHSQFEAEARLAQLNRHFPTRAPLSGFAPLN